MIEVVDRLFVGNKEACVFAEEKGMYVLHAAKTCHQNFLGYHGRLDVYDPNYLVARGDDERNLFLNLIDAPNLVPSVAIVESALGYLTEHHSRLRQKVLVHCDQGESRAPSLAWVYLVLRMGWVHVSRFRKAYPNFNPSGSMRAMLEMYGAEVPSEGVLAERRA